MIWKGTAKGTGQLWVLCNYVFAKCFICLLQRSLMTILSSPFFRWSEAPWSSLLPCQVTQLTAGELGGKSADHTLCRVSELLEAQQVQASCKLWRRSVVRVPQVCFHQVWQDTQTWEWLLWKKNFILQSLKLEGRATWGSTRDGQEAEGRRRNGGWEPVVAWGKERIK